jgi:hypothetical protein
MGYTWSAIVLRTVGDRRKNPDRLEKPECETGILVRKCPRIEGQAKISGFHRKPELTGIALEFEAGICGNFIIFRCIPAIPVLFVSSVHLRHAPK